MIQEKQVTFKKCIKCKHISRDSEGNLESPGRLLWFEYPARVFICKKWNGFIVEKQSAEKCKDYTEQEVKNVSKYH